MGYYYSCLDHRGREAAIAPVPLRRIRGAADSDGGAFIARSGRDGLRSSFEMAEAKIVVCPTCTSHINTCAGCGKRFVAGVSIDCKSVNDKPVHRCARCAREDLT